MEKLVLDLPPEPEDTHGRRVYVQALAWRGAERLAEELATLKDEHNKLQNAFVRHSALASTGML